MSYQEHANKINRELRQLFNSIPLKEFTKDQREYILNIVIQMGQVIKFRCRNNTAYDNFISLCFNDIAEVKRVDSEKGDWKTLKAFIN